MNDTQRREHERGLRVRDFAETLGDSLPAKSKGAQSVARINELVDQLSALEASHATNKRAAQAGTSGKKDALEELRNMLKRLVRTAEAAALDDPTLKERFRLPKTNKNTLTLIGTARSFLAEATALKSRLSDYGLTDGFLETLGDKIDEVERYARQQNAGASERKSAAAAISAALEELDAEVVRLDAVVRNTFADDPARLAAWEAARRVERAPRRAKAAPPPEAPPETKRAA